MELDKYELAWAAGFFDGEGTIRTRIDSSRHIYLAVSQTDVTTELLLRFKMAVGGPGAIYRDRGTHYVYQVSNRGDVGLIINKLRPFLGEQKRKQADEALKSYDLFRSTSGRVRGPGRSKYSKLVL